MKNDIIISYQNEEERDNLIQFLNERAGFSCKTPAFRSDSIMITKNKNCYYNSDVSSDITAKEVFNLNIDNSFSEKSLFSNAVLNKHIHEENMLKEMHEKAKIYPSYNPKRGVTPEFSDIVDLLWFYKDNSFFGAFNEGERFPFQLKKEDALRIIDIACLKWKKSLSETWSDLLWRDYVKVSEEFYKNMRQACTEKQHKLFDEIFGTDGPNLEEQIKKIFEEETEKLESVIGNKLVSSDNRIDLFVPFNKEEARKVLSTAMLIEDRLQELNGIREASLEVCYTRTITIRWERDLSE